MCSSWCAVPVRRIICTRSWRECVHPSCVYEACLSCAIPEVACGLTVLMCSVGILYWWRVKRVWTTLRHSIITIVHNEPLGPVYTGPVERQGKQTSKGRFTRSTPHPRRSHAGHGRGMANVNQTRLHCVDQMGKTHSKPLAARHGRGRAGLHEA